MLAPRFRAKLFRVRRMVAMFAMLIIMIMVMVMMMLRMSVLVRVFLACQKAYARSATSQAT